MFFSHFRKYGSKPPGRLEIALTLEVKWDIKKDDI